MPRWNLYNNSWSLLANRIDSIANILEYMIEWKPITQNVPKHIKAGAKIKTTATELVVVDLHPGANYTFYAYSRYFASILKHFFEYG